MTAPSPTTSRTRASAPPLEICHNVKTWVPKEELVDELETSDDEALTYDIRTEAFGSGVGATMVAQRVRDSSGRIVGTVIITKPAVGMNTIGTLAGAGDLDHFARMRQFASAGRRPTAVVFADLEGSAPLAKRLPTSGYLRSVHAKYGKELPAAIAATSRSAWCSRRR